MSHGRAALLIFVTCHKRRADLLLRFSSLKRILLERTAGDGDGANGKALDLRSGVFFFVTRHTQGV